MAKKDPVTVTIAPQDKEASGLSGQAALRVIDGPDRGRAVSLGEARSRTPGQGRRGTVLVGTGETCDLRLQDTTVSRQHLSVELVPEGLLIKDLGSKNGTFYLGTRVLEATIPLGAIVELGASTRIVFDCHSKDAQSLPARSHYGALIGASMAMRKLYQLLEKIEAVEYPVLILGETGVGKELVAREIHGHSRRAGLPFEVCDCASMAAGLSESELFGHERGAFTGAERLHRGVFERAQGGTVFLDELGELPLELQPKLLRVLENRTLRRVGGEQQLPVQARIVAATHRDLCAEVEQGNFRRDLFFRLGVVQVSVPPLRLRPEDVPALAEHIVKDLGDAGFRLSSRTIETLSGAYDWPGNVRELRNVIAQTMTLGSLPETLASTTGAGAVGQKSDSRQSSFREAKKRVVDAFERDYLLDQLERAQGNISLAARSAGMERNHFKRLLKKHGLGGS